MSALFRLPITPSARYSISTLAACVRPQQKCNWQQGFLEYGRTRTPKAGYMTKQQSRLLPRRSGISFPCWRFRDISCAGDEIAEPISAFAYGFNRLPDLARCVPENVELKIARRPPETAFELGSALLHYLFGNLQSVRRIAPIRVGARVAPPNLGSHLIT